MLKAAHQDPYYAIVIASITGLELLNLIPLPYMALSTLISNWWSIDANHQRMLTSLVHRILPNIKGSHTNIHVCDLKKPRITRTRTRRRRSWRKSHATRHQTAVFAATAGFARQRRPLQMVPTICPQWRLKWSHRDFLFCIG